MASLIDRHNAFADVVAGPADDLRFQTLFEHAPFSVQLLSADGRTLAVNKAWDALWGVDDLSEIKAHLFGAYNILSDPQLEANGVAPYLRRAFAGETVHIPPVRYDPAEMHMPGRPRWLKASAHPIRDRAGQVAEVMLVHQDITDQVETEAALRASEARLRQLANTIPQLAWIADPEGRAVWFNDRWYDYTGMAPCAPDSFVWRDHIHPDDRDMVMEKRLASFADGEPLELTLRLRGAKGEYRPFLGLVVPVKDASGKVEQWFGTCTDISALEGTRNQLHVAEERLRLATDAGDIGIWEWDIAANTIIWSDRVYANHGLDPAEFTITVESLATLIHPDDFAMLWKKVEQALAEKGGYSAEFRAILPDGSLRWLSTWARVEANPAGDRLIGAVISVDEHKRAQAALEENSRRKDQFLAMLAHELRNPLAPISVSAELLRLPGIDGERVRQTGEVISRQVGHMTKLIDDLMDVSRVTRGLIQIRREALDLKTVVASAVEQVRPMVEERRHGFTTRMAAGPVYVDGDRTRLVQVLSNLLSNAAKYTPPGGEIALEVGVAGGAVTISVGDSGEGIEPDLLPCIFDLFTQGPRALDRSQGGLGIGLALVRGLVEMHGGTVEVRSEGRGRGSVFTVTLPLIDPPVEPVATIEAAQVAGRARKVVVVDDNIDAGQSLAILLEAEGHEVAVFVDGTQALARAEVLAPDVFILDIGLPDMTGYELAAALKRLPACAGSLMVALTGYGQARDREQAMAAGFDHHFVKPVDYRALAQLMAAQ